MSNVMAVQHKVSITEREVRNGHASGVMWLTGLPGAGKSTLAIELELQLYNAGYQVYVLDGDNLRRGINRDLGFQPTDREENIRRVGEVSALFARAGFIVISAFISPYQKDRYTAREVVGIDRFHEVFIDADPVICAQRDPKNHYRKASAGKIEHFTGVSAPYEIPQNPDLVIRSSEDSIKTCTEQLVDYVNTKFQL